MVVADADLGKIHFVCLPEIKSWAGASRTYGYPDPRGQTNHIRLLYNAFKYSAVVYSTTPHNKWTRNGGEGGGQREWWDQKSRDITIQCLK